MACTNRISSWLLGGLCSNIATDIRAATGERGGLFSIVYACTAVCPCQIHERRAGSVRAAACPGAGPAPLRPCSKTTTVPAQRAPHMATRRVQPQVSRRWPAWHAAPRLVVRSSETSVSSTPSTACACLLRGTSFGHYYYLASLTI
jgi:hypothetical protein